MLMPSRFLTCPDEMVRQAAEVNPAITGIEMKSMRKPAKQTETSGGYLGKVFLWIFSENIPADV